MTHIFISYKREDYAFAQLLESKLLEAGFKVWLDKSSILGGEHWEAAIDRGIDDAFALVVVMSPEAEDSKYVTYEWAYAWGAKKLIIPVMLRFTEMHPRLRSVQHIDASEINFIEKLVKVLNKARVESVQIAEPVMESDFESDLETAIANLVNRDAAKRQQGLDYLSGISHVRSNEALVKALINPYTDVRARVAQLIDKIFSKGPEYATYQFEMIEALPELSAAIRDTEPAVRLAALQIVLIIGKINEQYFELVLFATQDREPKIRNLATETIAQFSNNSIVGLVYGHLYSKAMKVRKAALEALHERHLKSLLPDRVEKLLVASNPPEVRAAAALAMGTNQEPQAVEKLTPLLQDSNLSVRRATIQALGDTKDPAAIEILIKESYKEDLQSDTIRALSNFKDDRVVRRLLDLITSGGDLIYLVEALGKTEDARVLSALQYLAQTYSNPPYLEDEWTHYLRATLRDALHRINTPEALELVQTYLSDL